MKQISFALFVLAAIATASHGFAATGNHVYLQASSLIAIPGNDLEAHSGVALALGASFDENHEIELEGIAFNTGFKPNNSASHREESDIKFKYLLATYRYMIPVSDSFRWCAGLSAGAAHVSYEITTVDSSVAVSSSPGDTYSVGVELATPNSHGNASIFDSYTPVYTYTPDGTYTRHYSGSNTVAAGGPQLGFEYDVTPHSTLRISAKWLYIAKTDVTTSGGIVTVQATYRYAF